MPNISIRIPDDLDERLSSAAEREDRPRSDVARDAIHWYLETMEKKRFMQALLADANRLTNEDTVDVAEDYILLDNEALKIGEPRARYKKKKS
jgi:predicted transcriptional regulator